MTNDLESPDSPSRARRGLTWALAAGGFLLYLLTLNPWVSLYNLAPVARVSGWTWLPEFIAPVYYLVTLPLKLLPTASVPVALNVLSAALASVVLWQLARCVLLLPHDRTLEQREREASPVFTGRLWWLPPIFAVTLCGLQLTFWEHATNGTTEMLDLLMFAYVVRVILEYRLDGEETWLIRAALVMGLGMSNNVAMVSFFPVFIAALIWVRGVSFFNARFLTRMFLCGLVGLSLYLLLPLITSVSSPELAGFWPALKANLGGQFDAVKTFLFQPPLRLRLFFLACLALVPLVVIAIRWASYFGDSSQTGQWFATTTFHFVHAVLLGVACWVALDPPFGPRTIGYGLAFLPFYFLGALGTGYFTSYFLLVFGPRIERRLRRLPTPILNKIHFASTLSVVGLAIVMPIALVLRNGSDLRLTNSGMMREYATSLMGTLPAKGILISDEPARQFLAEAFLAEHKRSQDYIVVSSDALKWDSYHAYLHRRHGTIWPAPTNVRGTFIADPPEPTLIGLLSYLAQSNRVVYLHPSFGYYFEAFYPQPAGLVYDLKAYPPGDLLPPPLSSNAIASNEAFFTQLAANSLGPILRVTDRHGEPANYFGGGPLRKIRLREHRNVTSLVLGTHFSRAINCWGVEAQKAGLLTNATHWFDLALKLNSGNVVANRNLEFNRALCAGVKPVVQVPDSVEDLFGAGRNWDQVLSANGPYDDPSLNLLQGYQYVTTGLYRQAAQAFDRVRNYSETDLPSRIWLAQLQLMAGQPDHALAMTGEIHANPGRFNLDATNRIELLSVEATAHYARKDTNAAAALIERAIEADPKNPQVLSAAVTLYNQNLQYSNSLQVVSRMLALHPDDPSALLFQGYLLLQVKAWEQSLVPLNKLLTLETNHPYALLNRAAAYFNSDRMTEAKADYETLVRLHPAVFQPSYQLTEIALRKGDTNAAIQYAQAFLNVATNNPAEHDAMTQRLRAIKGEPPK